MFVTLLVSQAYIYPLKFDPSNMLDIFSTFETSHKLSSWFTPKLQLLNIKDILFTLDVSQADMSKLLSFPVKTPDISVIRDVQTAE